MKRFGIILVVGLLLSSLILASCSSGAPAPEKPKESAKPVTIKLGHTVNEKDAFHVAAVKFKELVEAKSNGTVKIELHPNGELGDERTMLEGMQMGSVDMGVITSGPFVNFVPEFGVVDLPFLFRDAPHAYKVFDGPIGKSLLKKLEPSGLKGLAFAERGFRHLTNSKRPIKTPEDVKGLKIRVMQNPVFQDTFKALGANAVPMSWTEVITALQQKTIDGQENPINVIYAYKLWETQKYMSLTAHAYSPAIFVMSLKLFNSLTPEQQKIIETSAQEAAEYERKWDADNEATQLKAITENGMKVEKPDTEAFRKAVKSIYDKYQDKFGKDLIEAIINTK
ncbi:MAG TPA: DctP family TRAP transporter solute-binding subunit [Firmicutes bacterium]|nr:DctP family TRAP transporter solute-binding subunit [Bacillota bacterium]